MPSSNLEKGVNDLATLCPEVASEADGWDPSTVTAGIDRKMPWKCKEGHTWETTIAKRSSDKRGCPFCSNKKCWTGFNDLKTLFPEVAKEADGWDPSKVLAGSNKKFPWRCKEEHTWNTEVKTRTGKQKSGCPYCSNNKCWTGFNDLKTLFPEVAAEADGWDPSKVLAGSNKKFPWKCELSHQWTAVVSSRSYLDSACPYCTNTKVWTGFNDLQKKFPEIAKEADGWDPSKIHFGSFKSMPWKCKLGHKWKTKVTYRTTGKGTFCPFCSNKKLLIGFNDLKTKFPEIAKEADGWDPSTFLFGTDKKQLWKCNEGHNWKATIKSRSMAQTGCPSCAEHGFNPDKPSWFYLMGRKGEQQLGITNVLNDRMRTHKADGWIEIEVTGPHSGQEVLDTEDALKKWLKEEVGLVPDKRENWYTSNLEVHSLAELKEKSGIETSIF